MPPGLRPWLMKERCGESRWVDFHAGLAESIAQINGRQFQAALSQLVGLLSPVVQSPYIAFDCATAVASAFLLTAETSEQLQLPVLAARFRQLSAIFGSFDYQMKGEEYIDQSPWPIRWNDGMDGILRSMTMLKMYELQAEPIRSVPLRTALTETGLSGRGGSSRIAIVSVCDYDAATTPLARLSMINKEAYAKLHGYDVVMYEKAPLYQDPLSPLFTDPTSHRPPAWSKIDALLTTMAAGQHDWVMWMDCDSFFMDSEVRLEDLVAAAEGAQCGPDATIPGEDLEELQDVVRRWQEGPPSGAADLSWYEELLEEHWRREVARQRNCVRGDPEGEVPENGTLGWGSWLFSEGRPHMIASEDGLMLNTGIMLLRSSVWSWRLLQQVRWMTFGHSPVTQHPWWEQTALVYMLQMPFALAHAEGAASRQGATDIGPTATSRGHARACFMLSQKHINGYPPIVASALRTHVPFDAGDYIVSFSGCKVYSSQEVCNQLFLGYFFQVHDFNQLQSDPALQGWL